MENYYKKWYTNNKNKRIQQIKERQANIWLFIKEQKIGKVCKICGEKDSYVLDFHHIDGSTKDLAISRCSYSGWSKDKILAEIKKCEILCSNCHRKIHKNDIAEQKLIDMAQKYRKKYDKIKKTICQDCDCKNIHRLKRCKKCYNIFQKDKMRQARLNKGL